MLTNIQQVEKDDHSWNCQSAWSLQLQDRDEVSRRSIHNKQAKIAWHLQSTFNLNFLHLILYMYQTTKSELNPIYKT